MGTIDKLWVKLTCKNCGVSEISSASDKGSGWNGSSWNNLGSIRNFDAVITGGGKEEPDVVSAKCKNCGHVAIVESDYGFSKPASF